MSRAVPACARVDYGVAFRALGGAGECGDSHLLVSMKQEVLVAAVDGLGHGPEASLAAGVAIATLEQHAGAPLELLMTYCHEQMKGTRGAALSLACLYARDNRMAWLGVGNVEGVLLRPDGTRASLALRGGVVGYRLPPLRVTHLTIRPGDTLIFATDGVASDFYLGASCGQAAQALAERILTRHGRETDDALVLVVRWMGWS